MSLCFECTQCGKCCHGLRLTLAVDEAITWAENGHVVQILTEALPAPLAEASADSQAEYDIARSFPAMSGAMPIRIAAVLVAFHEGACPYLQSDMRCGNYADRPRICRIYPLESRPFSRMSPERRLCPPEAWTSDRPLLLNGDRIADTNLMDIVADHRRTLIDDVPVVAAACAALGIASAAFSNEGLAAHHPVGSVLAAALRQAKIDCDDNQELKHWTIVTNREVTRSMLAEAGCTTSLTSQGEGYLGSFPDEV
ncbi:MAG: YkgJ family cysteine cluster protein [Novosphingobium sp.]